MPDRTPDLTPDLTPARTPDLTPAGTPAPSRSRTGRIAYATYLEDPADRDTDWDLAPVREAFARRGVRVESFPWDDPEVAWGDYDSVLLRSAWDYTLRYADFLTWARRVAAATRLLNPLDVVERNTDKTYLRDLEAAGVPVVPTRWYGPGEEPPRPERIAGSWSDLVVKPAVSAGARDTLRTSDPAEASAHVEALARGGRVAMVQPYLDAVDTEGEYSVVVLGGEPSHAITKVPALSEGGRGDARGLTPLTPELRQAAARVLEAEPLADHCAWARVDLVRDAAGVLRLMELELTEPLLFLWLSEGAADRLADVVLDRLDV
jgi:glutathione synthase/RimK-type ligase-like ATP-grasp enzyme